MDPYAASGLQFGTNVLGSLINYGFQRNLNQQSFEQNVAMWEMMNEYNTPTNQMLRFKAAGLNPNLIYGQGNPGNATSPPTHSPPQFSLKETQLLPFLQFELQQKLAAKSMEKTDAEIDSINAGTAYTKENTNVLSNKTLAGMLANDRQAVENHIWYELNNVILEDVDSVPGSTKSFFINYDKSYDMNYKKALLSKIMKEIDLISERIPNINADTTLKEFEAKLREEELDLGITGLSFLGGAPKAIIKNIYRFIQYLFR